MKITFWPLSLSLKTSPLLSFAIVAIIVVVARFCCYKISSEQPSPCYPAPAPSQKEIKKEVVIRRRKKSKNKKKKWNFQTQKHMNNVQKISSKQLFSPLPLPSPTHTPPPTTQSQKAPRRQKQNLKKRRREKKGGGGGQGGKREKSNNKNKNKWASKQGRKKEKIIPEMLYSLVTQLSTQMSSVSQAARWQTKSFNDEIS